MKEIVDKISSYNIFNNLFPGIIFAVIASKFTSYNFIIENEILGGFLYYFIGLIISRIGSLVVEKIFKTIKLIEFKPYEEFITASAKDSKIEILSETNNTFRTIIATMLCLLFLKCYNLLSIYFNFYSEVDYILIVISIMIIFSLAYKKQIYYISKRIEKANA